LHWRFEKEGFETAEIASAIEDDAMATNAVDVTLQQAGAQPGMVFVPAGPVTLQNLGSVNVEAFFIDRYEVTNAEFKEFVAAGGYERRSYWEGLDLEKDGVPLAWEDAMRLFVDTTGRAGPATWELGGYPAGQGRYPVTGVSWYEAAAYARFRGKSLPTVYHWSKAVMPRNVVGGLSASIVPASNYASTGVAAVGTYLGMGPFGTYDMYGNVSEWAWNRDDQKRGWTLGGNWQDAAYNFSARRPRPLLERSPLVGLRLMHDTGAGVPAPLLEQMIAPPNTPTDRRPVSDEVFAAYAQPFSYRAGELHVAGPVTVETTEDWVKQRVTVDTGYGERMDVFLFVPSHARPPYQALVYFPPFDAVTLKLSSDGLQPGHPSAPLDFIVKSGRVFVHPIYQGTYERFRERLVFADGAVMQRRWLDWRSDMGRVLDYLQTRGDVDSQRIGYIAVSFGAVFPLHLVALDERFRAAVLLAGGLPPNVALPPSIDPINYAARVKIPVLLMNGRFDYILPVDSQNRLFDVLGTPPDAKRHVLVDSGHVIPRSDTLRESLGWLDEYLGPAQ
jgi:predicted esterase